jgi:predicted O-linked N-acetylglucosamine transferase (SPINDLY family)
MQMCDWSQLAEALEAYCMLVGAGRRVGLPFPALSLLDEPRLHQRVARIYAAAQHPAQHGAVWPEKALNPGKVRVGYFSANFHDHATAFLLAGLIEVHDRGQFEIMGFSCGPDRQDAMRLRMSSGFDAFYDVHRMSDAEVAAFSRTMGVDIAVDLDGYTQGARPGMFTHRCGALQVSYLGFPGTTGTDHMDYIIADEVVLPEDQHRYYAEKVITLPCCYQANDSQRQISPRVFTREEVGLPAGAFVFCCFNNNYKIVPATFACWMRILHQVPSSVLWLLEDNPFAANNLREAALAGGIAPERLVFAARMPVGEHLARHGLADLFVDTWPYNAHTTASDALWAGLPVLTCRGQSFASRVAASLLQALNLPELIATTELDFETKAVRLANDAQAMRDLKARLQCERTHSPLFSSKRFARHVERAFQLVWARHVAGLPPQSMVVPSS